MQNLYAQTPIPFRPYGGRRLQRPGTVEGGNWGDLTEIEKTVVILSVIHDLSAKEVADKMGRAVQTVKFHLAVIYRRLGVSGMVRLGLWVGLNIDEIDPEYRERKRRFAIQ